MPKWLGKLFIFSSRSVSSSNALTLFSSRERKKLDGVLLSTSIVNINLSTSRFEKRFLIFPSVRRRQNSVFLSSIEGGIRAPRFWPIQRLRQVERRKNSLIRSAFVEKVKRCLLFGREKRRKTRLKSRSNVIDIWEEKTLTRRRKSSAEFVSFLVDRMKKENAHVFHRSLRYFCCACLSEHRCATRFSSSCCVGKKDAKQRQKTRLEAKTDEINEIRVFPWRSSREVRSNLIFPRENFINFPRLGWKFAARLGFSFSSSSMFFLFVSFCVFDFFSCFYRWLYCRRWIWSLSMPTVDGFNIFLLFFIRLFKRKWVIQRRAMSFRL